ncbi:MAG TPA: phenylacetate-CoA oxygenase subunit PaaJ [Ferruginibacter sp.]|nr:phenylacetate-CoA oxygenase subunit PaaJ [Ferruginibacter sp.]
MTTTAATERIWELLEEITDPEIPVLTIIDMGIVRDVQLEDDKVTVTITPTYSGCPAMDMIALNIRLHLIANGLKNIEVISVLSPAWTTDWMTESGKKKLQAYGIAPPQQQTKYGSERLNKLLFETDQHVVCPRCHSTHTQLLSQFGSTACKALYQCNDCKEPFDYFKCH